MRCSALSITALRDAAAAGVRGAGAVAPFCVAALGRLLPGPHAPAPPGHGGRRPRSRSARDRARNTHVSQRLRRQCSRKPWAPSRFPTSHRRAHSGCIDIHRLPSAASGCRWTLANLIVYGVPKWPHATAFFLPSRRRLVNPRVKSRAAGPALSRNDPTAGHAVATQQTHREGSKRRTSGTSDLSLLAHMDQLVT